MAEVDDWAPVDDWVAADRPATFDERFGGYPAHPTAGFVAKDVGRSVATNVARAGADFLGFPGDVVSLGKAGAGWLVDRANEMGIPLQRANVPHTGTPPTSADVTGRLESAIGSPLYQSQTAPGRYVGSATRFAANPLSYYGAGSVPAKIGIAGTAGVGSEGARDLAKEAGLGETGQTVAGIVGAIGAGGVARSTVSRSAARAVPTLEERYTSARGHYNAAEGFGLEIAPFGVNGGRGGTAGLANTIRGNIQNNLGILDTDAPSVHGQLGRLSRPSSNSPNMTIGDIEKVRQRLNDIRSDYTARPDERRAALSAINDIEDYYGSLHGNPDVVNNAHFADRVQNELNQAREDWASMRKGQDIDLAGYKAENRASATGVGANAQNAIRSRIANYINQNVRMAGGRRYLPGFTDEEFGQMQRVVDGSTGENLARLISRVGPRHPLIAGIMATGGVAGGAAMTGGLAGAGLGAGAVVPFMAAGEAAHRTALSMTRANIDRLDRMIGSNSALGRQRGATPGPYVPPWYLAHPYLGITAGQQPQE